MSTSNERTPLIDGKPSKKVYNGRGALIPDSDDELPEGTDEEILSEPEAEVSNLSPSASSHSIVKDRIRASNRKASQSSSRRNKSIASQPNSKTPLLPQSNYRRPSTLVTVLCYALLVFIIIILLALATVHFFVGRTISKITNDPEGIEAIAQRGLVYTGPEYLHFDSINDSTVKLTVRGRAGVNVAHALNWDEAGLVGRMEKHLVRWGVKKTKEVQVRAGKPIVVSSPSTGESTLLQMDDLPSFTLPLRFEDEAQALSQDDQSWLQEIALPIEITIMNPDAISAFVNRTWEDRLARIKVTAQQIQVAPQGLLGKFGKLARLRVENVHMALRHKIPDLPFLEDPSSLVDLKSYSMFASEPEKHHKQDLFVSGNATAQNPLVTQRKSIPNDLLHMIDSLGNATYAIPKAIPFDVFLLANNTNTSSIEEVQFAKVDLNPFEFFLRQPSIAVSIFGQIQPQQPASPLLDPALSDLLSRYLDGRPTPIHIKPIASALPQFMQPLVKSMPAIPMSIPGSPDPDAQLMRNVRIEKMRIDGTSPTGDILCSGTVMGELYLPAGLDGLNSVMDISELWPDVLVFDGSPPSRAPVGQFPPANSPVGAFARLKPEHWTKAKSSVVEVEDPDKKGRRIKVTRIEMQLEEVPMSILPGRGDVFRSFIAKIIFGAGDGPNGDVLTGIWGLSNAEAQLPALGRLELEDVAIKGEFYASKRSL